MESDRIILRHWTESDAPAFYKYASDPDLGPRAGWEPHKSVEESLEAIRTFYLGNTMWAIVLKETNEIVGCIGYLTDDSCNTKVENDEAEIGYWVGKPFWNQGICTEAIGLLVKYCFEEKGFSALFGEHFEDNPASGKVMEKCGFQDTGIIKTCPKLEFGNEKSVRVLKLEKKH